MASSPDVRVQAFIGNIPTAWGFEHVQQHFKNVGLPVPQFGRVHAGKGARQSFFAIATFSSEYGRDLAIRMSDGLKWSTGFPILVRLSPPTHRDPINPPPSPPQTHFRNRKMLFLFVTNQRCLTWLLQTRCLQIILFKSVV